MKIKFNKNSVFVENEKWVTTFDRLFFEAFNLPSFIADTDLLDQLETAITDVNDDITIDCTDTFIKFLDSSKILYTILEEPNVSEIADSSAQTQYDTQES